MLPEPKWKLDHAIEAGMVSLFGMLLISLGRTLFAGGGSTFSDFVFGSLVFHGGILVAVQLLVWRSQATWGSVFGLWGARSWRSAGLAAGVTVLFLPLAWLLSVASGVVMRQLLVEPRVQQPVQVLQTAGDVGQLWLMGLLAVVLAPIAEELLFRGVAYPSMKAWLGGRAALVGTSVLFGAVHMNMMTFVALAVFGAVLVWLYEHTETLLAPVVAHAVFNLANFFLILLQQA